MFVRINKDFTGKQNRHKHYQEHVIKRKEFGNISEEDYDRIAEQLMNTPVDNKTIFGYIGTYQKDKPAYCKWNKETNIFVAYTFTKDNKPKAFTCYIKTYRSYYAKKIDDYYDEIPQGM